MMFLDILEESDDSNGILEYDEVNICLDTQVFLCIFLCANKTLHFHKGKTQYLVKYFGSCGI